MKKYLILILLVLLTGCSQSVLFGAGDNKLKLSDVIAEVKNNKSIKEEYTVEDEKFIRKEDKKNDKFKVKVGEGLKPELEISKWDEEVKFKIKPRTDELKGIETKDKEIKYSDGKAKYRFYDIQEKVKYKKEKEKKEGKEKIFGASDYSVNEEIDGYEFEIELMEAPENGIVTMDIETENLDFFYQPALNAHLEYASSTCTETECNGARRPENVVGSYAVYHSTKRDHIIGQTDYKTGKAFHIYRPKIIDTNGDWVWGQMNINNGILTIEIKEDWLNKAVYPIIIDPTFGYSTLGASGSFYVCFNNNDTSGTIGHAYELSSSPALLANITIGTFITESSDTDVDVYASLYSEDSDGVGSHDKVFGKELIAETIKSSTAADGTWHEFAADYRELEADDYIIAFTCDGNDIPSSGKSLYLNDDTGVDNHNRYRTTTSGTSSFTTRKDADPWAETYNASTYLFSIYATYTSSDSTVTDQASNVTATSSTMNGRAVYVDEVAMDLFFNYGTSSGDYTSTTTLTYQDSTTSTFSQEINGLDYNTTYYIRAGGIGTTTVSGTLYYYGDEVSTTTLQLAPISTIGSSNIAKESARLNGSINELGNESSFHTGFAYGIDTYTSTTTGQTISSVTTFYEDLSGLTTFSDYVFRAFATTTSDIWYGDEFTFFTADISTSTDTAIEWNVGDFSSSTLDLDLTDQLRLTGVGGSSLADTESFENTYGDWTNDTGAGSNCWSFDTNNTGSNNTGPSGPQDGTYYTYAETSGGSCNGSNWDSITYTLSTTIGGYVDFYYHMYGAYIGTLSLQQYDGSTWETVWSKSGQQEQTDELDDWTHVTSGTEFDSDTTKIRFYYTGAGSYTGDAGIDFVKVYETSPFTYDTPGTWISQALNVGLIDAVDDTFIEWVDSTGANTSVSYYTGLNTSDSVPPVSWTETSSSGGSITGVTGDLTGKYLWTKVLLETTDTAYTPYADNFRIGINGGGTAPETSTSTVKRQSEFFFK